MRLILDAHTLLWFLTDNSSHATGQQASTLPIAARLQLGSHFDSDVVIHCQ